MKKIITVCLLGAALALTACATKQPGDSDYGYEQSKGSRMAGAGPAVVDTSAPAAAAKPASAEKVFAKHQHK